MGDVGRQEPIKKVAERLYQEMVEREYEGEPLESKATAYLNYVLQRERIRRGATDAGQRRDAVDYETLQTLKYPDSDEPQHENAMLPALKWPVTWVMGITGYQYNFHLRLAGVLYKSFF